MSFLEKIGLSRKKQKPFHVNLDKKKAEKEDQKNKSWQIFPKLFICLGFLVVVIALYPRTTIQDYTYSIGEPWRDDDVTAPFTFSLLKSDEQIEEERQEVRETTPPIFYRDHEADNQMSQRVDSLFNNIAPVLQYYANWQISKNQDTADAEADSIRFEEEKNQSGVGLDRNGWQPMLESYAEQEFDRLEGRETDTHIALDIRNTLEELLNNFKNEGIIDRSREELNADEITIRDDEQRTERTVDIGRVLEISEARSETREHFANEYDDAIATTAYQLVSLIIEPNLNYDEAETMASIEEAKDDISLTQGAVSEGQVIIRRGDIVNEERYNKLESLAVARADRATDLELWQQYLGESIILIALFLIFFMYLYLYRRKIYEDNSMFLLVFLVLTLIIATAAFVARLDDISPYIVPITIAPIILTIIFDSRVGLMTTVTVALITGFMFGNSFEFILATITAASMGVYSVRDIKNRSQLYLTTPGLVFSSYLLVLLGFTFTKIGGWDTLWDNSQFLAINAIGIWLTYPLILVIEKLFRVTTDITLLELSDTNQPVLKKMMIEAPGSFHHSLQVANLSETAASAIGANSLLCRVGGLYHDIGKLGKPGYFTENQSGENEHDKQTPRMSAQIIKEHVSKGVKMAQELELPEVIIDFIRTHHGTTLIKFFYQKALDQASSQKEIREEDFRYDGPIPNSRETGILLLADCIEASSRSMKEPSYQKLEKLVNRMVEERVTEGQLNNTPLTFQELRIIRESFLKILVGMYHGRVKYPGQEAAEASEQKSMDAERKAEAENNQNSKNDQESKTEKLGETTQSPDS